MCVPSDLMQQNSWLMCTTSRLSQFQSIAQATKDIPAVAEMLKKAQAVLGYDLLKLCLEGPKEQLDETRCTQALLRMTRYVRTGPMSVLLADLQLPPCCGLNLA
jgi:hypothetical protein